MLAIDLTGKRALIAGVSDDGGFGFVGTDGLGLVEADANAYRGDLSVGLGDLFTGMGGRLTLYGQTTDAGYSTASLFSVTDTQQYGGAFTIPITDRLRLNAKADSRSQTDALDSQAGELDVGYDLTDRWSLGLGVRHDNREDISPIVPVTQEEGARTDALVWTSRRVLDGQVALVLFNYGKEAASVNLDGLEPKHRFRQAFPQGGGRLRADAQGAARLVLPPRSLAVYVAGEAR